MGRGEISLVISRLISRKGLYKLKGSRPGRPVNKLGAADKKINYPVVFLRFEKFEYFLWHFQQLREHVAFWKKRCKILNFLKSESKVVFLFLSLIFFHLNKCHLRSIKSGLISRYSLNSP